MKNDSQISEFLTKLDKITFDSTQNRNTLKGKLGGITVKVSYSIDIKTSRLFPNMPLQIVVKVFSKEGHVTSWGCTSNEENSIFVKWWEEIVAKVESDSFRKKDALAETINNMLAV